MAQFGRRSLAYIGRPGVVQYRASADRLRAVTHDRRAPDSLLSVAQTSPGPFCARLTGHGASADRFTVSASQPITGAGAEESSDQRGLSHQADHVLTGSPLMIRRGPSV